MGASVTRIEIRLSENGGNLYCPTCEIVNCMFSGIYFYIFPREKLLFFFLDKGCCIVPGGTVGYPAHPRLIRPSVILSVRQIRFNYSAENRPDPTDLLKYCLKNVN